MNSDTDLACLRVADLVPGTLRADFDARHTPRTRALRSRLHQAMAELSVELHARLDVRRVIAVVWTGARDATPHERELAVAAAENLHARSEMIRGEPLSLAVIFADDDTSADRLDECLRTDARAVPDGVSAMSWVDACTWGIPACAAANRI